MATIVTRSGNGTSVTNAQIDANFNNLNNDKLETASYTAADVLAKLLTVDGVGSGLDADLLDGQSSAYYTAITARLGYTPLDATAYTAGDVLALSTISDVSWCGAFRRNSSASVSPRWSRFHSFSAATGISSGPRGEFADNI